ncbi:MAG: hypothetical protein ACTSPD_07000 [Promethearchaeota archaeon]
MSRTKKIFAAISIIIVCIFSGYTLRYLFLIYDPFCVKNWNCNPDWEPPNYYKDGIAESLIEECARFSADNLEYSQSCNGRFKYIYDAAEDKYDDSSYSIVRHAGAVYAILDLYKEIKEEKYLDVGVAGLNYLLAFNYKINKEDWAINYDLQMKVGTVSLTILAMVRYYEATDDDKYNNFIEKYANFIVSRQRDDGAYAGSYESNEEELYYSAEAFFALALAYDVLENEKYLKSIEKAIDYYWSEDYDYLNSAFIPWASSGCVKWYEITKNEDFLDFCFEMTDVQILRQHLVNDTDELGNYLYGYIKNPTVNTGVYLEGIGDALRIAKEVNDSIRIQKYHDTLKAGIEWVLSLQFRKPSQLACPNRGFGGFHRGFTVDDAYLIRIDYNQHAISAILRVLREFTDEEIENINIRDGNVDFEPSQNEISTIDWLLYSVIIGLIALPGILIYFFLKSFFGNEVETLRKTENKSNP